MALAAIFQIGSLGDSLVSIPSLRSLHELLPDVSDYLLVTRLDGKQKISPRQVFNMAVPCRYSASYLGSAPRLRKACSVALVAAKLRFLRPKYAVYLLPSDRTQEQVDRDRRFFRAAGVRNLLGFRTLPAAERARGTTAIIERTEAYLRFRRLWGEAAPERFASFLESPFLTPPPAAVAYVRRWLSANRRFPQRPLVAFAPFSNWQSRDLPQIAIAEISRRLEHDFGVEVLFSGGAKDRSPVDAVLSTSQSGINTCGNFSLEQSAALFSECNLLLGADSGPMHLAAALGVPTIAVFSRIASEPGRWFPMGRANTILYRDVPCAGCEKIACPVPGHPCIEEIGVAEILSAAASALHASFPVHGKARGTTIQHWDFPLEALTLARQFGKIVQWCEE